MTVALQTFLGDKAGAVEGDNVGAVEGDKGGFRRGVALWVVKADCQTSGRPDAAADRKLTVVAVFHWTRIGEPARLRRCALGSFILHRTQLSPGLRS